MSAPAKPEAEGGAAAAAPARKPTLLVIAAAAVVLLGGGGGAAWFLLHRAPPKAEAKEDPNTLPEHVLKIGTLVVNIAGTEGRRYLRTTVELGTRPKDAKHLEEMRAPLLDGAIGVLGSKEMAELLDPGKREELRNELRERLNKVTGGHGVSHVFLTEFVIQ
jgi:flagellar protein FliL